ncbi:MULTISPECIES: helix-turn-helix domain-containing protein [Photorhabdus]|uniref:helix-turn-helix domain-containing protein n=1 Tax=Photorhabdus TaxID=29487 RepID=UPI000DCE1CB9|nr:helix-turn-helix transcriptional regulator [Photorhabdus kleinii]RAW96081.1 hypothetical protein CKY03_16105 [Photorhabdus sp. S9-53]RAW96148.1 hypothetical protein CKY05_16185 [Photorhabdus sp. S10-54]RAX00208.1 hypothetical protein CKY04_16460 [Photorhabdus sp. S8-52]
MGVLSNSYAEKLKLIRKAEGLTQVAFAKELGLGLRTVKNYETGHKDIHTLGVWWVPLCL